MMAELVLHDQKDDGVHDRYSIMTTNGEVLFLFNESKVTARDVFDTFNRGIDAMAIDLILRDVLDSVKELYGEDGLVAVTDHATAINRAREHNAEIDALEVALNSDERRK